MFAGFRGRAAGGSAPSKYAPELGVHCSAESRLNPSGTALRIASLGKGLGLHSRSAFWNNIGLTSSHSRHSWLEIIRQSHYMLLIMFIMRLLHYNDESLKLKISFEISTFLTLNNYTNTNSKILYLALSTHVRVDLYVIIMENEQ